MSDLVKRLRHTLGSVSVDEHMHGDNLAILLCSFYEDAEGEIDDNGWTEVAVTGCERTLDAIHAHYADRIEALEAALAQIDALDPEGMIDACSQAALRGLVLRMGEIARDARQAREATR